MTTLAWWKVRRTKPFAGGYQSRGRVPPTPEIGPTFLEDGISTGRKDEHDAYTTNDLHSRAQSNRRISRLDRDVYSPKPTSYPSIHSIRELSAGSLSTSNRSISNHSPSPVISIDYIDRRSTKDRALQTRSPDMNGMPSFDYGFLMSPDPAHLADGTSSDPAEPLERNTPRARSVNSAYDSLPSWDSESTWLYERRRRPPSPAWRRDEGGGPGGVKFTLYDHMQGNAPSLSPKPSSRS